MAGSSPPFKDIRLKPLKGNDVTERGHRILDPGTTADQYNLNIDSSNSLVSDAETNGFDFGFFCQGRGGEGNTHADDGSDDTDDDDDDDSRTNATSADALDVDACRMILMKNMTRCGAPSVTSGSVLNVDACRMVLMNNMARCGPGHHDGYTVAESTFEDTTATDWVD